MDGAKWLRQKFCSDFLKHWFKNKKNNGRS